MHPTRCPFVSGAPTYMSRGARDYFFDLGPQKVFCSAKDGQDCILNFVTNFPKFEFLTLNLGAMKVVFQPKKLKGHFTRPNFSCRID